MKVVAERPTVNPGICFLCEQSNDCAYVDTERAFDPPGPTHLNGRKFVCQFCAEEMGRLFGQVEITALDEAKTRIAELEAEVEQSARVAELVDAVREAAEVVKPKKAPAKKAA